MIPRCTALSTLGIWSFPIVYSTGAEAIFVDFGFISSPGHRPCELLSWVSVRPSVRPLVFHI